MLEGGSIHVDGEGTLITTEECLLNRNRNPHLSREEIEAVLSAQLAVDKIIWLPDGLFNDETDGHVDNFCCYVRPGEVLLAWTDDPQDPNYTRCHAAMNVLQNSTDAKGRPFTVHKMPIPGPLYATEEECAGVDAVEGSQERNPTVRLAGSYVNFLIVNGGIIAPSFDDPLDAPARDILQNLFPQHEVVMVPGRELLLGGRQYPLPYSTATCTAGKNEWRCNSWVLSNASALSRRFWIHPGKPAAQLGRGFFVSVYSCHGYVGIALVSVFRQFRGAELRCFVINLG
nr:hypothetical protein GCM10020185_28090 [Pseudomonas brassicacearum subsp. brassicacearum]